MEKIISYVLFVEQCRLKYEYPYIYAADETAVYLDYSSSLTVEEKGAKEVSLTVYYKLLIIKFLGISQNYWSRQAACHCNANCSI